MRKADALDQQLSLTVPATVTFEEGGSTVLTPANWVPELSNTPTVSLDGDWQVIRWPFPAAEDVLLGPSGGGMAWGEIQQPGKVFYYDPEQSPDAIAGWNRVTQEHVDAEDGAIIRRTVRVPVEWAGRRILLRFEGIYPAGKIYWDGELVAEQWSGLTPLEIDVTDRATPGTQHSVAVRLYRRHPSIQLDMPRHALDFTGLSRQAFLHSVEQAHVCDLYLLPELADDYTSGELHGEIRLRNTASTPAQVMLTIQLTDAAGRLAAQQSHTTVVAPAKDMRVMLDMPAGTVDVWNAEQPYLYTLTMRMACEGQLEQVITRRLGFRRFEFKDQRPLLNGNPVKFRGVNHLTFHPEFGMYTPEPWLRQCLIMMKRANVNAIRTHFYGPPELADLCDELGIYLLQELPIDWGHTYLHEPVHFGPVLHRLTAGVRRDRNHASLMVWSIGNENLPRNEDEYPVFMEHLQLFNQLVKRMDPSRPTMFPPPGPANAIKGIFEARIGDIADTHYSFNLIREFNETGVLKNPRVWGMVPDSKTWQTTFETQTREELLAIGWSGVWFSSEYGINNMLSDLLNAPYTSIIADVMEDPLSGKNSQQVFIDRLNREWGYMRDDPTCLGGAYFPWIAAGAGDPWGWTRWGEDADWGVVTGDLQAKPAFWAMRVIFSPVQLPAQITWRPGEKELRIPIHNAYNSINLAACTLRTQMGGGPPYMGMLREWRDVPMTGAPGETATVIVPIWNPGTLSTLESGKPVVCRCTILDPTGYRPIMADVLVSPQEADISPDAAMPVGPDAVLE
ncbi:MAG: glycoside hydrolase family 2 protein [Armatimonadota bacterium]